MNTIQRISAWTALIVSATTAQAAPTKPTPTTPSKQQAETAMLKRQVITMAKKLVELQRENEELRKRLSISAAGRTAHSTAPTRRPLATAPIQGQKLVDRVEATEIAFPPHFQAGLHLHACPVVGRITAGAILFQIDGQPPQTLHAGDTFLEPANARIVHFDSAGDGPATFTAFYLAGKDDHELVTMLPKAQN